MKTARVFRITQLRGHQIWVDGAWRTIASVTGPHRPQFGARGSFWRVSLLRGYQDASGRIYPDSFNIWRGDDYALRPVPQS